MDGTLQQLYPNSFKKSIEAVATAVPVEEIAARYTTLRPASNSLRGRCPIHHGANPDAFAVYPGEGSWYCFRCNIGGDVVSLHFHAGDFGEMWEAMIDLAVEYNVELPRRPERWHDWQDDKAERWASLRDNLAESYRRRYFRAFYSEYLLELDPEVREAEAKELWKGLRPLARMCADQRINR